jgi:CheY-like chemotaxis protein
MAGEPILIVDDTPVNLKLTRILLVNEGYHVLTAASAEEALELLQSHRPHLILADIQLPGMDGLEMTRRIKGDPRTRDITVVALTAFAMKGDEQKAMSAGCDGYITKPIDTRTLGERIRHYLDARGDRGALPPQPPSRQAEVLSTAEMQALRRRFLDEGQERSRQILLDLEGAFDPTAATRTVHQWIGAGGLLGYPAISRLSRDVETLLLEKPVDSGQLRESLTNLVLAFSSPREARDAPLPDSILQTLAGKFVAVVGLPSHEAQRLCVALETARARPVFFDLNSVPDDAMVEACDIVVVYVRPDHATSPWLDPGSPTAGRPTVFVGSRDDLLALDPQVQAMAPEFLMDSWQPEEALVRLSLALSPPVGAPRKIPRLAASGGHVHVLVVDDEPAVLSLVCTTLESFGMSCIEASDGAQALELVRSHRPEAAVLDVNMPGMDGYEVLAAIRRDGLPTRVMLLTARQQESDILRGFTLGADDYVVKPFSPMELVARLKRLLVR